MVASCRRFASFLLKSILCGMLFLVGVLGVTSPCADAAEVPGHILLGADKKPVLKAGAFGGERVMLPDSYREKAQEFRAVWVSTVFNLDWSQTKTPAAFQIAFLNMISRIQRAGFNTLIFQIRPCNDAFYSSKLNPWSRFMNGSEGVPFSGGWDPLKYMISECHKRGIRFYAWMNPFRVGTVKDGTSPDAYLKTLDARNFARLKPNYVLRLKKDGKTQLFLDPGEPSVRMFVVDTVKEVIDGYNVDGIVFDDYFYPYEGMKSEDYSSWRKYRRGSQKLEDWRRSNTEQLIRSVSTLVRQLNVKNKRSVRFGVSPFGIWANKSSAHPNGSNTKGLESYSAIYCDTLSWVKNNLVDFIIPQIYWGLSHQKSAYAELVDWWCNAVRGTKVKLYISHAVYKSGDAADMKSVSEIPDQLLYNMLKADVKGSCLFSYHSIFSPANAVMKTNVKTVIEKYWRGKLQ